MSDDLDPELERRAQALLMLAAESLPTSQLTLAPPVRRRRWPLVAAAAAAVVVVVSGAIAWLAPGADHRSEPSPAPRTGLTVPQTRWMTTEQARHDLEESGLVVVTVPKETCAVEPGRVLRSSPAPGAPVERGGTIEVTVSRGPAAAWCAPGPELALGLLDLARSGSTDLHFADRVQIYVDGERTRTLSAAEAVDPGSWGDPSPLSELVDRVADLATESLEDSGHQYACGSDDPPTALRDRPSTILDLSPRSDRADVAGGSCEWLRVYRDAAGRVDAVAVSGRAHRVLADDGAGNEGAPALDEDLERAGRRFAAFGAGGGQTPDFAPEVRLLLGSQVVATVPAEQAADPSTWRLPCHTYAERSCPIDALEALHRGAPYAVTATVARTPSACATIVEDLPTDLASAGALARSVSLSAPEPDSCIGAWEIQLWLDEAGRIDAANLILGSP